MLGLDNEIAWGQYVFQKEGYSMKEDIVLDNGACQTKQKFQDVWGKLIHLEVDICSAKTVCPKIRDFVFRKLCFGNWSGFDRCILSKMHQVIEGW